MPSEEQPEVSVISRGNDAEPEGGCFHPNLLLETVLVVPTGFPEKDREEGRIRSEGLTAEPRERFGFPLAVVGPDLSEQRLDAADGFCDRTTHDSRLSVAELGMSTLRV